MDFHGFRNIGVYIGKIGPAAPMETFARFQVGFLSFADFYLILCFSLVFIDLIDFYVFS